ncbi:uncharacterized protein M6B38_131640 [Iris pallida]|uniref:Uncharacterized protein n=1 Tax=Iris pallida TaxID=29817 RepID=A0AAX6FQZ3_IRIPA|nr:uncharacterized protein M6B38_131640 [Iris pallida]
MSSPARSSASAASGGQGGGGGGGGGSSSNAGGLGGDDTPAYHFPTDLVSVIDRKKEALAVLRADLMEALNKEVKSLDDDSWMFAGPRSRINLISRPGSV